MAAESPIFIVGMPRSGTSLTRAVLDAHPRIAIAPETHFLSYWVSRAVKRDIRSSEDFERFWTVFSASRQFADLNVDQKAVRDRLAGQGELSYRAVFASLLQAYAVARGKPRWGENTALHHRHVDRLLAWFPQARIIYMLRDPRSVVASLLDAPWADPSIELQASRWRDSVRVLAGCEGDPRVCVVFYEALVSEPADTLRRLDGFVGESVDADVLGRRTVDVDHGADGDCARDRFQASPGPISTDSINRWQERLSPEQVAIVEYLTQSQMRRVGYQPVTTGPGMEAWIALNARRGGIRLRRLIDRFRHRRPELPASDRSV